MKTPIRPAALHLFVALCLGVTLAACEPLTTVPEPQDKLDHLVRRTHELDSLTTQSARDLTAIDPQPRTPLPVR